MYVVLMILKTAGILLLSVLGLVLLLLCAVLFVPVTYRIRAQKGSGIKVRISCGWMFRLLSAHYYLENGGQDLVFRAFGIPFYRPWKEKPARARRSRTKKEAKKETRKKETYAVPEPYGDSPPVDPSVRPSRDFSSDGAASEKTSFFRKAAYAARRFCDRIRDIWNAFRRIPGRIRSLLDRKEQLLEFWNLEEHRQARAALWKEFLYLRDKLRPKKAVGYIHFGFSDPAATGVCMGAASVLYAWYPERFELRPDFEEEVLEGDIFLRGRLRLYVPALIALRIWFNQDIRRMYRRWQEL